uniref:mRNA-capping enzyme n=1 Tax=Acrobeloides nanus TaxID=290746 RepID=A0A914BXE9_9BILA
MSYRGNFRKRKAQNNEGASEKQKPNGPTLEVAMRFGPPARWLHCPKMGRVVGRHFLPFKTPLCGLYDGTMEKKFQFHPVEVFNHDLAGTEKGAKVGLWLDLTNTSRYYPRDDVEKHNCTYKKLALAGHKQTPSEEEVQEFVRIVKAYFEKEPNGVVGIHCTHGFNRTGFLIVAYLCLEEDWALEAAVREFAMCRPYGIYKQDYLDDLKERYGDDEDLILETPGRPGWENGPEATTIRELDIPTTSAAAAIPQMPSSQNGTSTIAPTKSNEPQFMDGLVPGVKFVRDSKFLKSKIQGMCGFKNDHFPGSQPVSLVCSPEENTLKYLSEEEYMTSWKADGVRYLVLIEDKGKVYAFDRDNSCYLIPNVSFPHEKERRHVTNTLIDSEMIIEHVEIEGKEVKLYRLLIYDIIIYEGENVGKRNFRDRFHLINKCLITPRLKAESEGLLNKNKEPIRIRRKDFWELHVAYKLMEPKFTQNLKHEVDGLIFQPVNKPYTPGRFNQLLKWKPPDLCTIDFKLQIRRIERVGELPYYEGHLFVLGHTDPFASMRATKELQRYNGKIIECQYINGKWQFLRERTDKSTPNAYSTAVSVCRGIQYPVSKEILFNYIAKHGYRPKNQQTSQ